MPYVTPQFIPNSYEITKESDSTRSVTLYWEPISEELHNAPGFVYVIRRQTCEGREESCEVVVLPTKNTYPFTRLSSHQTERFTITARNNIGASKFSSEIKVFAEKLLPPKPLDVNAFYYGIERGYEVRWESTSNEITSYTIVWCSQQTHSPGVCTGRMHYKHLPRGALAAFISEIGRQENYQFAVAAVTKHGGENVGSGLSWSSCVVPMDLQKIDRINNVTVAYTKPTSMKIVWKLPCPALSGVIEEFDIKYCNVTCNSTKVVGGRNDSVIIENLAPNTVYRVELRARALRSVTPNEATTLEARTLHSPPEPPTGLKKIATSFRTILIEWDLSANNTESLSFSVKLNDDVQTIQNVSQTCAINQKTSNSYTCSINLASNIHSYREYNISVATCTDDGVLCSNYTKLGELVRTQMSAPGNMEKPHAETINSSFAKLTWDKPNETNGLVNLYELIIFASRNVSDVFTTNATQLEKQFDCEKSKDYHYSVKAINTDSSGREFRGPSSVATAIGVCKSDPTPGILVIIGIALASCFSIAMVLFVIYITVKHFQKQLNEIREKKIELPPGLDGKTEKSLSESRMVKQLSNEDNDQVPNSDEEDDHVNDEDRQKRHASGSSHTSSYGIGSSTSGHGSGCSPSNSSNCVIPMVEMKNGYNTFQRALSDPTSEQGESVASEDNDFKTNRQRLYDVHVDSIDGMVSETHPSSNLIPNQHGYVTLPSQIQSSGYSTCNNSQHYLSSSVSETKERHGSGTSQSSSSSAEFNMATARLGDCSYISNGDVAQPRSMSQSKPTYVTDLSGQVSVQTHNGKPFIPSSNGYVAIPPNSVGNKDHESLFNMVPVDHVAIGNIA